MGNKYTNVEHCLFAQIACDCAFATFVYKHGSPVALPKIGPLRHFPKHFRDIAPKPMHGPPTPDQPTP